MKKYRHGVNKYIHTYIHTYILTYNETKNAQNYRPIALQNAIYKIYTGILEEFILDHCQRISIITEEQATGKTGNRGCIDQLLINKMIYEEMIANRRN